MLESTELRGVKELLFVPHESAARALWATHELAVAQAVRVSWLGAFT